MSSSLLDPGQEDEQALYHKLLLDAAAGQNPGLFPQAAAEMQGKKLLPKPGFCLKTKSKSKEKVFVNICMSDTVPDPKDMTDEELIKLLESDDPTGYRIPMSIGEPHAEIDKSGSGCTAYDVVVSPKFYAKMQGSELFKTFFLTVMMEGLEAKYNTELSRDWIILKNRKFVGSVQEQYIRTQSKPFIMEMDQDGSGYAGTPNLSSRVPLIQEVDSSQEEPKSRGKEPEYRIIQDPPEGHPEYLVAEINLPQVKTMESLTLDIGEDRILLQTRSNIYFLDIYLPFSLIQEDCGAQFNRKTRILTITMPVQDNTGH